MSDGPVTNQTGHFENVNIGQYHSPQTTNGNESYDHARVHNTSSDGHHTSGNTRPTMATNVVNGHVTHVQQTTNVDVRSHDQSQGHGYNNTRSCSHHNTRSQSSNATLAPRRRSDDILSRSRVTRDSTRGRSRSAVSNRSHGTTFTQGASGIELEEKDDRYVVPALPMPLAIFCCILNFMIPGFGSMMAAVCVFCCAKASDMTFTEKCGSCFTVFGIGVLQLLLVACFLIGWIWSCIWGITFIGMSASFYNDDDSVMEDDTTVPVGRLPTHRGGRPGATPLPTPQIVEDQPYPGVRYDDIRAHERRQRQESQRRTRSRMSNLIYPMRAPSNIAYNSPPPSYEESMGAQGHQSIRRARAENSNIRPTGSHIDANDASHRIADTEYSHMAYTIHEEQPRR